MRLGGEAGDLADTPMYLPHLVQRPVTPLAKSARLSITARSHPSGTGNNVRDVATVEQYKYR
jgi:hypothetical protein